VKEDLLLPSGSSPRVQWGQLYGSAAALRLAQAAEDLTVPLAVVAANARAASQLAEEMRFFAPADLPIAVFPDWETLPYDLFSPHPDIVSKRLQLLAELPDWKRGILVVDLETLLQRIAPTSYIQGHAFDIRVGAKLNLERLRERLTGAGYAATSQVMAPGEFALRGSLLDVFPMGYDAAAAHRPVRREDRQHPPLRSRDAAFRRERCRSCGCCRRARSRWTGRMPGVPPPLSHALRGRPHAQHGLSRRRRRSSTGRHRVLPAAVLREAPRRCSTTCRVTVLVLEDGTCSRPRTGWPR
jgi:hypothetical protein